MREFVQTLSDFTKGLRPDANMPRNSGYATELYNVRCGVAGLEVPPLIAYPISGAPVVSWPLPQLIKINGLRPDNPGFFFLSSTNPQYMYLVMTDYTLAIIYAGTSASPLDLGTPGRYTVADFGWYQVWHKLAVPATIVLRYFDSGAGAWFWQKYTGGGEMPPYANITCVCNFRGQLIVGLQAAQVEYTRPYLVAWSNIGSVTPSIMLTTTSDYYIDRRIDAGGLATKPYKRTSGNYRIGPHSIPHRVLPLGNGVMVYCSDRIFYLKAASMPEPTFGIVPIANFGIPSTFCAEGDESEHLIVTSNKEVWKVKEGPKLERLGYKEYMDLLTGTIVISKNPNFGDYYISNGSKTYLLSQYGLSQWFQHPTSLIWEDANKRLIGPIAVAADVSASMASDVYDFGVRALKTITTMEIGATGQVMTANIDYKYKVTDSAFTASRFKTASNFGAVTSLVSGTEFKMRVKGADYTKFDLDYLNVRYKYVDKRMIRGVYAKDAKVLSRSDR